MNTTTHIHEKFARFAQAVTVLVFSVVLLATAGSTAHAAGIVVCGGGTGELSAAQAVSKASTDPAMKAAQANFQTNSCQLSDVFKEAALVANGLIALSSAVALVFIVWAGFNLILFSDNEKQLGEAEEHMKNAIIGLVIVLLAFLVINGIFSVLAVKIGGASSFPYNPFTS
jgi:hypothetical protein